MKKRYKSSIMAAIHETAEDLHSAGVMTNRTLRDFDALCLTPVQPLTPQEVDEGGSREYEKAEAASWLTEGGF